MIKDSQQYHPGDPFCYGYTDSPHVGGDVPLQLTDPSPQSEFTIGCPGGSAG